MTVCADEFPRRFFIHVLPRGLVRIRHFGLFANADGPLRCRLLLNARASQQHPPASSSPLRCPLCSAEMLTIVRMTGSTCAALLTGRKYIGIELDSDYHQAKLRLVRVKGRIAKRFSNIGIGIPTM